MEEKPSEHPRQGIPHNGDKIVSVEIQRLRDAEGALQDPFLPPELATAIFDFSPLATVVVDGDAKIKFFNKKAEFLFGYNRNEIVGKNIEALVPAISRGAHEKHRTEYLVEPRARPMSTGLPLSGLHKSGAEFTVEIELSPVSTSLGLFVIAAVRRRPHGT